MTWKRILAWGLGGLVGLALVLAIAGYFVLRSERFHQYVIATVERKAVEATGGIEDVAVADCRVSSGE